MDTQVWIVVEIVLAKVEERKLNEEEEEPVEHIVKE